MNGRSVDPAQWGRALPVDPGNVTVDASAKGKRAWTSQLQISTVRRVWTIAVPALENEEPPPVTQIRYFRQFIETVIGEIKC